MHILLDIVAVAVGLVLGGVVGYAIGRRFEDDRTMLWTLGIAAFTTAWVLDLAGRIAGQPEVSFAALGLMAGLVSGVKYGGFPPLGARGGAKADADAQPGANAAPGAQPDAQPDADTDAPANPAAPKDPR